MKAARGPRNGASSTTVSAGRSRLRRWRIPSAIAIAGLVLGLCASSASASFLYYRTTHNSADLVYAGLTNGEHNFVTEQLSGGELLYTEVGGPLITSFPDMCREITPIQVACSTEVAPGRPWTELAFEMHDNDDFVDARTSVPTRIVGRRRGRHPQGGQRRRPDPRRRRLRSRRAPTATTRWTAAAGPTTCTATAAATPSPTPVAPRPVFVSIDGVANDGHGGEGDNVQPTVENLVGGKSADQLAGNGSREHAHRRTRRRSARGIGRRRSAQRRRRQRRSPRRDRARPALGDDRLDTMNGGADNDRLLGGEEPGRSRSAAAGPTSSRAATAATTSTTPRSRRRFA